MICKVKTCDRPKDSLGYCDSHYQRLKKRGDIQAHIPIGGFSHGYRPAGKATATYNSWRSMKMRCSVPKATAYERYGGRGIKICKRWNDFTKFLADMGPRPKGKTLDRKNNDKGYTPSNCRWATPKQQANNRRKNHI